MRLTGKDIEMLQNMLQNEAIIQEMTLQQLNEDIKRENDKEVLEELRECIAKCEREIEELDALCNKLDEVDDEDDE